MDSRDLQERYFAALREKYEVYIETSSLPDRFLYLILRKADLGIPLSDIEFQYLADNLLFVTAEIISLQQYKAGDRSRLEAEFIELQTKYQVPKELELPISSTVYSVLSKFDAGHNLADFDLKELKNLGLLDTITLIQESLNFSNLKEKFKATRHLGKFPEEPLFSILKKLDLKEPLSESEAEWLLEEDFGDTLEIVWQQEKERKAEREFSELKSKYQVDSHPETSIESPLYSILKKLSIEEELARSECAWLKQQNFGNLLSIAREYKNKKLFVKLKEKYKATAYKISEPSSRLFLILNKFEISDLQSSIRSRDLQGLIENPDLQVSEEDILWLSEEKLLETAEIGKQIHFKILKSKYQIVGELALDPFYEIMLKLERQERLDPKQVIQLIEEDRLSRHGKIATAYHRLEAIFYEKEYRRTGNRWNLPSASSNWRKANEPEQALKVTETVNWHKVQESDLRAAIWGTRGAAFRDLDRLDEAENCAMQAMECQPESHQPYTLMGAIEYDRSNYPEGDRWFKMAAERGADDTDDEIKRIIRMTKDKEKRREVVEYLLDKDPNHYKWAKSYLK